MVLAVCCSAKTSRPSAPESRKDGYFLAAPGLVMPAGPGSFSLLSLSLSPCRSLDIQAQARENRPVISKPLVENTPPEPVWIVPFIVAKSAGDLGPEPPPRVVLSRAAALQSPSWARGGRSLGFSKALQGSNVQLRTLV